MTEIMAYAILWLLISLPVGICFMAAMVFGIRMNWFTMAMLPAGFVFLIAATISPNRMLFLPAALLLLGHLWTIRAVQQKKYVHHF